MSEYLKPSGFRVEVANPHAIYEAVISSIPLVAHSPIIEDDFTMEEGLGTPIIAAHLSETPLEGLLGPMFFDETTDIALDYFYNYPRYSFESYLTLSYPHHKTESQGFYSLQRVARVAEILQGNNIASKVKDRKNKTTLLIDHGDKAFAVEFGYQTFNAYRNTYGNKIEKADQERRKILLAELNKLLEFRTFNLGINIKYEDHPRLLPPTSVPAISEPEFTEDINFYAKIYEQLLVALYKERDLQPPPVPILFSAPPGGLLTGVS